ncbi:MAG TPA: hypothetical protein EYP98_06825, partial [Planctomycetes bacterium]|nr:hypothetical protein [Planctomycetota bacterium]
MKRAQENDDDGGTAECKQLRASTVRLNVGGRFFETTAATLAAATYFEPMLSGRIGQAIDDDGRLFIDRSPDLFAILLEFMRNLERPSGRLLREYGEDAIAKECEYYGLRYLPEVVRGALAPEVYMRAADRRIKEEERAVLSGQQLGGLAASILLDVHKADTLSRPREALQQPLLLAGAPQPSLQGDYSAFYTRLCDLSGGLVEELRDIPRIVIAGGSVLAALTGVQHTDIDVFLVCVSPDEAVTCLRQIIAAVQRHHAK